MKNRRLNFINTILVICFLILAYKLFDLTIIKGDYYRNLGDNQRMKQIDTYAARGNILDRDGEVLAGNKPIYNLNVYTDRFYEIKRPEQNNVLLNLVHTLESDGVNYLEDYFFGMYEFKYANDSAYFSDKESPSDKIVKIIQDNKLIEEIISSSVKISPDKSTVFYPVNRIIDYLQIRGKNFPMKLSKTGQVEFDKNSAYKQLLEEGLIDENTSAKEYLLKNIKDDKSLLYYLINHPLSRKLVYDIIKKKNLQANIELTDLVYVYDLRYIEQKAYLSRLSNKININTNPKDDFVNLVIDNSLKELLETSAEDGDNKRVIPADILLKQLEAKGIKPEIVVEKIDNSNKVAIKYEKNTNTDELAVDKLIKLAKENKLLEDFILNEKIVQIAEQSLINTGIYPRIYKSSWQYSYVKDKEDLLARNDAKENTSARDLFKIYKEKYSLEGHDDYEIFGVISIYNNMANQGYRAYAPITLAKNINQNSLVEIEETIPKSMGFEVVVQPNRYYPNDNLASHVLGYLGRISESSEIEEYVQYKKYDRNDIVGKSGLEESFEDTLRGSKGSKLVYTNVMGETTETIEETPSVPGNNLYTTIDKDLQKATEDILIDLITAGKEGRPYYSYYGKARGIYAPNVQSGAAVVMNTKTGEILAMASYPDYNPNLFVNGISDTDWKMLSDSSNLSVYAPKPLLNIATQAAMPPGSTFKTVTSLAALNKGYDPNTTITCMGFLNVGNQQFSCEVFSQYGTTHGSINLYDALRYSCNYYFYSLGLGYNPRVENQLDFKVELDDIVDMTEKLKLKKSTGIEINIPYESSGYSPSVYGKQNLVRATLRNWLDLNLSKYTKEKTTISNTLRSQHISEIVSWVDVGANMTRTQVISKLDALGYKAEEILDGTYAGLADTVKYSFLNQAVWTQSDSLNMVIGQGQNAYTPMQIVQLASIIANEGVLHKPTLIKEIKNYDDSKSIFKKEVESEQIDVNKNHFKAVKEGMRRTMENIEGRYDLPFQVGAKTGTAESDSIDSQTGDLYQPFAWEMAFAPYEEPEIATVIVLVQGRTSLYAGIGTNDLIYAYNKYIKKDNRFTNERSRTAQ
ncbi:penicillin-binding transpeptidase domain-containing protein [Peptoniphilaceae bacterium SGI.131]